MFSSIHVVSEIWRRQFSGFLTAPDNLCFRGSPGLKWHCWVCSRFISLPSSLLRTFSAPWFSVLMTPSLFCGGLCVSESRYGPTWAGFLPTFRPIRAQGQALSSHHHGLTCSGPQCWCGLWMPLILPLPASSILSSKQKKLCCGKTLFSTHWVMRALLKM